MAAQNAQRWQLVKSILDSALEVSGDKRTDFLAQIGDADLRREVESFLAFENDESDPFEVSAFEIAAQNLHAADNYIGKQIGSYRVVEEIGRGGMGVVFLAERADFKHKVALKLIRRGFDSDAILRRFFNERQILASLEHQNIARLLDGGTTDDGQPFFVMECVTGVSLTEFVRRENLSINERLALFCKICAAVAYAHRNLVVHRDLKPSNILVTADMEPKLLDFGIAKLLKTEAGGETATQQFVFTPEYASPEQMRGEKLSTATDIYSLGVIFYELLTDQRPHPTASPNPVERLRVVTAVTPPRPSTINISQAKFHPRSAARDSQLRDLDFIALKALRVEPEKRYLSVDQFTDDIARFQNGLPIAARRGTNIYYAEKFARRNKTTVLAAALILISLIGGVAATVRQAQIAEIERAKAVRRFDDVRQLANSFMFEIDAEIQQSPIKARELLLKRSGEYLDQLAAEAADDESLQTEVATAYQKIGDVQAELYTSHTGNFSGALDNYAKALKIREELFQAVADKTAPSPEYLQKGIAAAEMTAKMGDLLSQTGNIKNAVEHHRRGVALNETFRRAAPENVENQRRLARAYNSLGHVLLRTGSLKEVLENYALALDIFETLAAREPENVKLQISVASMLTRIAFVKELTGDETAGLEHCRRALGIIEKLIAVNPSDEGNLKILSAVNFLYAVQIRKYDAPESLKLMKQALEIDAKFFQDSGNSYSRNNLADAQMEYAKSLAAMKNYPAAFDYFARAKSNYELLAEEDAKNINVRRQIYYLKRGHGDVLRAKGDLIAAHRLYDEARQGFAEITAVDANNAEWQHDLAQCYLSLAETAPPADHSGKRENFVKAKEILIRIAAESPLNVHIKNDLQRAVENLN